MRSGRRCGQRAQASPFASSCTILLRRGAGIRSCPPFAYQDFRMPLGCWCNCSCFPRNIAFVGVPGHGVGCFYLDCAPKLVKEMPRKTKGG